MQNVLLKRKKLVSSNVDLVARLKGCRNNALLRLDGEVDLVDGTENFVDLANRGLMKRVSHLSLRQEVGCKSMPYFVLEVDRGVEVRNLGIHGFANHLALASVHKSTHLWQKISHPSSPPMHSQMYNYPEPVLAAQFVLGILRGLPDENFVSNHQSSTLATIQTHHRVHQSFHHGWRLRRNRHGHLHETTS